MNSINNIITSNSHPAWRAQDKAIGKCLHGRKRDDRDEGKYLLMEAMNEKFVNLFKSGRQLRALAVEPHHQSKNSSEFNYIIIIFTYPPFCLELHIFPNRNSPLKHSLLLVTVRLYQIS